MDIQKSEIRIATDAFCDKYGFEKSKDCTGVVSGNVKSVDSIVSRVNRNMQRNAENNTLGKIYDLSRCAIIVDNFSEVPKAISILSEKYQNLTGYICETKSGYVGIHLNATENNIPIEIQISTPDAWLVKQASEYVYSKHRDFAESFESELKKIYYEPDITKQESMKKAFKLKNAEYENDYAETRKLFELLHSQSDLNKSLPPIKDMLLYCNIKAEINKEVTMENLELLNKPLIDEQGKISEKLIRETAKELLPAVEKTQENFIENITEANKEIANKEKEFQLNSMQKFVAETKQAISEKPKEDKQNDNKSKAEEEYKNFIEAQTNIAVSKITSYALDLKTDFNETTAIQFLTDYKQQLANKNILLEQNDFTEKLKNAIPNIINNKLGV